MDRMIMLYTRPEQESSESPSTKLYRRLAHIALEVQKTGCTPALAQEVLAALRPDKSARSIEMRMKCMAESSQHGFAEIVRQLRPEFTEEQRRAVRSLMSPAVEGVLDPHLHRDAEQTEACLRQHLAHKHGVTRGRLLYEMEKIAFGTESTKCFKGAFSFFVVKSCASAYHIVCNMIDMIDWSDDKTDDKTVQRVERKLVSVLEEARLEDLGLYAHMCIFELYKAARRAPCEELQRFIRPELWGLIEKTERDPGRTPGKERRRSPSVERAASPSASEGRRSFGSTSPSFARTIESRAADDESTQPVIDESTVLQQLDAIESSPVRSPKRQAL